VQDEQSLAITWHRCCRPCRLGDRCFWRGHLLGGGLPRCCSPSSCTCLKQS